MNSTQHKFIKLLIMTCCTVFSLQQNGFTATKRKPTDEVDETRNPKKPSRDNLDAAVALLEMKTFPNNYQRSREDIKNDEKAILQPNQCEICEKILANANGLARHMRIHTGARPLKCNICTKSFSDESNFTRHKKMHSGSRPFKCKICNKSFTQTTHLTRHKKSKEHLSKEQKTTVLQETKTSSNNPQKPINNAAHIKTPKKRPYACDKCSSRFGQERHLTEHKNVVHTLKRSHECTICPKKFARKGDLNKHITFHKKEKPHKCIECDKGFKQKGDLNKHMATHYKCNNCQARFKSHDSWKNHEQCCSSLLREQEQTIPQSGDVQGSVIPQNVQAPQINEQQQDQNDLALVMFLQALENGALIVTNLINAYCTKFEQNKKIQGSSPQPTLKEYLNVELINKIAESNAPELKSLLQKIVTFVPFQSGLSKLPNLLCCINFFGSIFDESELEDIGKRLSQ